MKKLMMMAVVGLGVLAARAEYADQYFYWNVMDSDPAFAYAKLAYTLQGGGKGYLTVGDSPYAGVMAAEGGKTTASVFANMGADADNWAGASFLVEAYNDANALVGKSDAVLYGDILASLYDYEGFMNIGEGVSAKGFTINAPAPVPEPTGALLILLGLAGLALRRRRG